MKLGFLWSTCPVCCPTISIKTLEGNKTLAITSDQGFFYDFSSAVVVIIIMQRLMRHVSVIRMTNRRRGGHVDLWVAVSVIKRL